MLIFGSLSFNFQKQGHAVKYKTKHAAMKQILNKRIVKFTGNFIPNSMEHFSLLRMVIP